MGAAGWSSGWKATVGLAVWLGPPPDEVWPSGPRGHTDAGASPLRACRRRQEAPTVQAP